MNGIEATTELLRHCPGVKVVILSMYDDENSVVSAIRSGARAFVLKKASSTELLDALRTVARGGSYLSSQVSDRLLQRIQRGDLDTHDRSPLESLSPRELQVLRLVAEGKTSKDIAVLLDLGLQTVRSYRKTMMKKLGVNNVAGPDATGPGRRHHPLEQARCKHRGVTSPSPTRTSISFRGVFSNRWAGSAARRRRGGRLGSGLGVAARGSGRTGARLGRRTGPARRGARGADRQRSGR